jgi:nucleoside-diphosphate-sugar epimerase
LGRRALLSGASGFVGAVLARRLLADGHDVHLLLRPQHNPWRLQEITNEVTIHEVDLGDHAGLENTVASVRPDWIFHLAAHGAYPNQRDLDTIVATNVLGTVNLVRAAERAGFAAFINTGSSSEYGLKDHAPVEDEWLEPNSDYAVTKATATLFCRHTAQRTRLPIITLRLYSVFGPYEEPRRLVPTLIAHGLEGHLPPLVNPDVARDYVHVDDVCDAYLLAASIPGQEPGAVYNVGTGVQTTLRQIVASARRLLAIETEPVWGSMPDRSWDTNVWISNPARIRASLGWAPQFDLEQGLARTIAWFRANSDQLAHYRAAQS